MKILVLSLALIFALPVFAAGFEQFIDQRSCASVLIPHQAPGLIVVSAPSGAGKTTLINKLLEKYPDRFVVSISTTTRAPRSGESDGKDYYFMSKEDFQRRLEAGDFIEWAEVHGNYYGTAKAPIEAALASGKNMILNIDVQGAANLRKALPGAALKTIFVVPPSLEELERRLRARGTETEESLRIRLLAAKAEMAKASLYDFTVVNDDLDRAFATFESILGL